jgi:cytoskeleton protein RodZ
MHSLDKTTPALHTEALDPHHDSPGRQLRLARENARISLDQVAAELHLSTATLTALEEDHYEGLPSPVFINGYLRSYARLLRLDPELLLDSYRRQQPVSTANQTLPTRSARDERSSSSLGITLMSAVVVAALMAGVWFWWNSQQEGEPFDDTASDENENTIQQMTESAPHPVLPRPVQALSDSPSAPRIAPSASMESGDAALNSESDDQVEEEDVPAPTSPGDENSPPLPAGVQPGSGLIAALSRDANANTETQAPSDDISESSAPPTNADPHTPVVMTFSGPCWVDVRDATGEFKLFGEMNDGDREVLGGQAPYSIILGNAAAVELTIGGEPFDVKAIARGNVARFDLDPARR